MSAAPASTPEPDWVGVSFVSSHAQLGGSERYLELLLGGLGADWRRGVVSLQDGPFVERLRALELDCPVEVVETPARAGMLPAAARLRRLLLAQAPDVVHANGIKAALVSGLAMLGTGIPVIWVKHDFSWDGWLARLVARRCSQVVGVSAAVIESLDGAGEKLRVVSPGIPWPEVDSRAGRARALELLGAGPQAEVVGLVGRLHPAKGQAELLEVIPALLRRRPSVRFLFVGAEDPAEPAYAADLRRRVEQLGVAELLHFAGHVDNAVELIAGCDLVVMPSVPDDRGMGREGFGLVAVEAMAVGTPVVGYADGALPELLAECGRLVPAGDRETLTKAIASLLDDQGLRARFAACGRERARTRFPVGSMVEGMKERYRDAASATRDLQRR